jgi:hypothetical protein
LKAIIKKIGDIGGRARQKLAADGASDQLFARLTVLLIDTSVEIKRWFLQLFWGEIADIG